MKRFALTLFSMAFLTMAAPAANGVFSITGTLDSIPNQTKVKLYESFSFQTEKPVAEAVVTDGRFVLTAKSPGIRLYNIVFDGLGGAFNILLNDEDVTLTGTARIRSNGSNDYFTLPNAVVTGSPLHLEFEQKNNVRAELNKIYDENNNKSEALLKVMQEARSTNDTAFLKAISQSNAYKALESREAEFFKLVAVRFDDLILSNKDSWWGPLLLLVNCNRMGEEQAKQFEQFSDEAKNSYYGKYAKKEIYPEGFKGKVAPAFNVTDASGKLLPSKQLMKGKKYILIDFWASWCAPCRKEIPNLKAQYAKYATKGLEIISISTDRNASDWQKALDQEKLPWQNYRDQNGIAALYNVKAIPSIFLINANGKVIEENLRGEALAKKLEELFK